MVLKGFTYTLLHTCAHFFAAALSSAFLFFLPWSRFSSQASRPCLAALCSFILAVKGSKTGASDGLAIGANLPRSVWRVSGFKLSALTVLSLISPFFGLPSLLGKRTTLDL